tara:strand:- start:2 stop:526 length:525 start_codon:yes stop_codon:yes gene_type:complete
MSISGLTELEKQATSQGLFLRLQVNRPVGLWSFKVVVATQPEPKKIKILGEMKGWAYKGIRGLQLDTMRVSQKAPLGVGHLIWATTMAWCLENTPCKKARLLAIFDDENQHQRLTRYFRARGFTPVKEVSSSLLDLPLRLVWGGAGSLMIADCQKVYASSCRSWEIARSRKLSS